MKDILSEIVAHKRAEIEALKQTASIDTLYRDATPHRHIPFSHAIETTPCGIIAEFKRRSPSKGWIHRDAEPAAIAQGYAAAGAAAMSVLTDEKYFGGTLSDLQAVRPAAGIPLLRKDFTIDEYQLHQAAAAGADAILLIAAALSPDKCRQLARTAHELGLETLLEVHSAGELEYLGDDIDVVGVNNRCLGTFHTDTAVSEYLAPMMPQYITHISESGIRGAADIVRLQRLSYRGFLIGELLMKGEDPAENLARLTAETAKLQAARP